MQQIELTEYESRSFSREIIEEKTGKQIWLRYRDKIDIIPPSFQTSNEWRLTSKGWVGHIPVDDSVSLFIKPKLNLGSLFLMLEYAYYLDFAIDDQLIGATSLSEFYQRLANILAKKVIRRTFKGLYYEYVERSSSLPYIRGRVNLRSMINSPWEVALKCNYHENTSDNEDNQVLAWTLYCIARTGICDDSVKNIVRKAYRGIQGFAQTKHFNASSCTGRIYQRLNADYQPMHALCRFFLDFTGPAHEMGGNAMLPFIIDMSKLYEAFVAEWLVKNLPAHIRLKKQEQVKIGSEQKVDFYIDIVLENKYTGDPICLLDTKYKATQTPSSSDLQQVIAYAKALGCNQAFLVYPIPLKKPFDAIVGDDFHVRSASLSLEGNLEENGQQFLANLNKYFNFDDLSASKDKSKISFV